MKTNNKSVELTEHNYLCDQQTHLVIENVSYWILKAIFFINITFPLDSFEGFLHVWIDGKENYLCKSLHFSAPPHDKLVQDCLLKLLVKEQNNGTNIVEINSMSTNLYLTFNSGTYCLGAVTFGRHKSLQLAQWT